MLSKMETLCPDGSWQVNVLKGKIVSKLRLILDGSFTFGIFRTEVEFIGAGTFCPEPEPKTTGTF